MLLFLLFAACERPLCERYHEANVDCLKRAGDETRLGWVSPVDDVCACAGQRCTHERGIDYSCLVDVWEGATCTSVEDVDRLEEQSYYCVAIHDTGIF